MYCRYKFDFFATHPHVKRPRVPLTPYIPLSVERNTPHQGGGGGGYQPMRPVAQPTSTLLPILGNHSCSMLTETDDKIYLSDDANAKTTAEWLVKNDFEDLAMRFSGRKAQDLRAMTLHELKKLCSPSVGKRLFQFLHQGRMTVYIRHGSFEPRTISLKPPSGEGLRFKLLESLKDQKMKIANIHIRGHDNRKVMLTDHEIVHILNGTTFDCHFTKVDNHYDLLLVEAI